MHSATVHLAQTPRRSLVRWLAVALEGVIGALAIAGAIAAWPLLGRHWRRWGALDHEVGEPLPCETPADVPVDCVTRAVTIHAPPDRVWAWLQQIGQNRGGFFSYELLENVIGCRVRNREELEPSLQALRLGDHIRFHPRFAPQTVTALLPGRAFEIGGWWTFVARPALDGTRLIVRTRIPRATGRAARLVSAGLLGPIHFVMERKMLCELRRLAERDAA